ncbi:MAG: FAD-dependent monooxygenase [Plectolyngbya sp. WJT66-NPBG17]|jgi:kynurenine 3-monooxygenase|nr:FAD-dependent monooxygenase [Plectolyngbya sp. WJT66-NPBG17]
MNVVIVGAGPAGLFLAHRLLTLSPDYKIRVYDCNPEPTDSEAADSRGFGLGLGERVQHWLNGIEGLKEQLTNEGTEFTMGGLVLIPRRQLCALLLRLARSATPKEPLLAQSGNHTSQLAVTFNTSVIAVDLARREITIEQETRSETVSYDLLVGADGIHSMIRRAMSIAKPDEINFQQRQRPQVWKVLQLSVKPESSPRIIRLQTRRSQFGLVFGACLPQKNGRFSALIFWQPIDSSDQKNPCGITTVEKLQQLLQEMSPKNSPALEIDRDQAMAFLAASPGREYWSQCDSYHHLEGHAVLIGDAAHGMFSLLGQGCTAAIADAVALSSLFQQHPEQCEIVLPQFSAQQVKEGHAASDLSLIALILYDRGFSLIYKIATVLWVFILRQPSIFAQINRVHASYVQVLQENRFWIWFAKNLY